MRVCVQASFLLCVLASVSSTPCLPEQFTCARGGCVSEEHVCDFRENCEDGSDETNCSQFVRCDFQEGFCGFQHHVWMRGSGLSRPSTEADHGENVTGHCLYIQSKNGEGVTAEIYSPLFQPSQTCWLTFYRHIGVLTGALQVLIQFKSSGEMEEVWFQSTSSPYPHTLPWMRTVVVLNSREEFKVVIRGLIFNSSDPYEVVAIDDLSFSRECVAAVETDIKAPLSTHFHCGANVSVDEVKVCDFSLDCPNGEDEANCSAQCNFESDSCGWYELIQGDGFEWVRGSANGVSIDYVDQTPPQDHSTNTSTGHFMFIFKKSSRFSQQALLRSPTFQQASSDCVMTFWHYNSGHSVGAAEMHLLIDGLDSVTLLWQTLYNQGDQWHPVNVQIGRQTRPFYISVTKLSLAVYEGVSALDDIMFHNCSLPEAVEMCPTPYHFHCRQSKACVNYSLICDLIDDCGDGTDEENCSPELMCDFEEGLCSWTQEHEEDMFDWTRIQGPTPTFNTGPWKDHTHANADGHFLFIESSEPQKFKDTALLISRPFLPTPRRGPETKPPCIFRFHYHMFGQNVFRLAVYMRTRNSGQGNLLWVRYGDQGNFWHRKILPINSAHHFQILVEGTVGDDFRGDIAIDDLSFLGCQQYEGELPSKEPSTSAPLPTLSASPPHSCPPDQFVCSTTRECVSLSQVCDFTPDCSDGSDEEHCVKKYCDFEGGTLCGWYLSDPATPVPPHAFRWQTGQGESIHHGEQNHRPANDHTLGSSQGWYIFADSSNGGYGHTTDLVTAVIKITGPQCTLVFWYHMSGFTVGTLQVFIKSGTVTHEVWSQNGNQGNGWRRGEIFVGIHHNMQVVLRAKRGISYMGDVVVDDVAFVDCAPPITSDLPCHKNEFICANGHCISEDNLCDFIDHCGDGSDENHYICKGFSGRCNFEFDLCSWRQSQDDDFDWLIKPGNMHTHGTGPSTDHTLRNPSGHYLYLEGSFPQTTGHTAQILGPLFRHCSKDCKMVFYVHMSGDGIGTLNMYMSTNSSHSLLLSLTGNQGNYWRRQEVPLSSSDNFRIMLEGKVGLNTRVHICLDDIIFSSGCILSSRFETDTTPRLLPGSCPPGSLQCNNANCYKREQKCDFTDDCGDGTDELECGTSCSFEHGRCGWKNSWADSFSWALGVGSVHMIIPPHDHTLKNESGHFVYLAATPVGLKGDKAHMRSSVWKESSATCKLAFWYYISEKATGIIRLFIKTENELREVWTEWQMHREWRRAEVSLRNLRKFILIFEVVRTQDVSGGAALDDLQFIDCAPRAVHPGSCPTVTDFVCNNGDCIEYHLECDGKADCSDESDELDCMIAPGTCNFDVPGGHWQETCQVSQDPHDDFDWDIGYGRMQNGTGPSADHNGGGGYLFVNSSAQTEGDIASLITQLEFPASVGICHLRFWFHMYGSDHMGTLKVYTVGHSGTPLLMWATCGNHGDSWQYANVILSNASPFRVSIQAEVGADQWTDIAVDDFSFTRQCLVGGPVTPIPQTCHMEHFQCLYLFECIPLSWHCDGEVDCLDLSDEEMCASVVPGTTPPQTGCETGEYRCLNNSCIPALLRCDTVLDCPNGEDEYGCPVKICDEGELVCEATAECIAYQSRCDNFVDCHPFNSDESSCYECPFGYCLNGGRCAVKENGPVCICPSKWTGNRCQEKSFTPTTPVIPDNKLGNWMVVSVGLSVAVILMVIATGVILFWLFQKRHSQKDSGLIANEELDSSTFDLPKKLPSLDVRPRWPVRPQLSISVYPWKEDSKVSSSKESKLSFSNPLYKCPNSSEA